MLREFFVGFGIFVGYYVGLVFLLLLIKAFFKPPRELFRKMLHIMVAMSILVLLKVFNTWYLALFTTLLFAASLYPILALAERSPKIMEVLVQRKKGELRSSLALVFLMMAILILLFWGGLGQRWKYIIIVSIMAWGYGDAAAALVGKTFGKRRIISRFVEGAKTKEGTLAMYFISGLAIFLSLILHSSFPWYLCLVAALLVAPVCALVELVSKRGIDTITVPLATAIPVFSIMMFFSLMGL